MYSQHKEDELIFNYIEKKNDGLYVDIGAGDYKELSNTYMLYELGWRGLAVEPLPKYHTGWKEFRPRDTFITDAISDKNGTVQMAHTVMEGTWLFEAWQSEQLVRTVKCRTFANLMEEYPEFLSADFFTMDIEMSEGKVLATVDFNKFKPTMMIIENSIRRIDSRPMWEHLILPYYDEVVKELGNSVYVRKKQ